jgi:hypothetical protein
MLLLKPQGLFRPIRQAQGRRRQQGNDYLFSLFWRQSRQNNGSKRLLPRKSGQ